ncbi:20S-pre-rRNA D-site endonuclease nob1 [Acrodontium crateriforme]|uniref:20S-pre-rRNA D-site endonuclease NOB1 n=1 Tax=Acrodontium crateriforme TaxID=150365 RepID=A0AAQ3MBJ6_9PEZI|nr:20S-pre-rRNA D-site endonuclease nob1 [Acrodontium crateriforme]
MEAAKPVHTLVIDTGAIIRNEPPISTLLAQSESLVTVPAIVSEIKDANTRSRFETTIQPFLTLRNPNPASIKFVTDFARRTGDLAVLSKPDVQIIALAYEIELERNGGDWRLRRAPGQKGVNGAPPARTNESVDPNAAPAEIDETVKEAEISTELANEACAEPAAGSESLDSQESQQQTGDNDTDGIVEISPEHAELEMAVEKITLEDASSDDIVEAQNEVSPVDESAATAESDSDSDSDGWITPGNLKKKQAEDAGGSTSQAPEPKTMQVAVLTTDYAMQNVILQINLNLLSPSLTRIKQLKTFVMRCHACFQVCKDMTKQFCPRCGQPTLTRVSCSTSANGEFKLHLKKNMQWNTRGDRYSIPKPTHGSSNRMVHGGGKGGWGHNLILAEDQKEFERATTTQKRQKERSLMDEDYLPGILTGDRQRQGGKIKVGAGRNVNSRKR